MGALSQKVGLLGPMFERFKFVREHWSPDAREGLKDTFYSAEHVVREGIITGAMQCFSINDRQSWVVVQFMPGKLFVWCYQGCGLVSFIGVLRKFAAARGIKEIGFFTHHRAALRALRRFSPVARLTQVEGEAEYFISCEGAAA